MKGSFNPVFFLLEKESWTYNQSIIRNKKKYDAEMFQTVSFLHRDSLFQSGTGMSPNLILLWADNTFFTDTYFLKYTVNQKNTWHWFHSLFDPLNRNVVYTHSFKYFM